MSNRADSQGWLKDGNVAFYGGVDAAVPATNLARTQLVRAVNCTMRGGPISPRSAWVKRTLTFATDEIGTHFKTSKFQHGSFYSNVDQPSLISSQSGRFFYINLSKMTVQEITPTTDEFNTTITGPIILPGVGVDYPVGVASVTGLNLNRSSIEIGGFRLRLTAIGPGNNITFQNDYAANQNAAIPNGSTVTTQVLDPNSSLPERGWSAQAGDYWVYQDEISYPIIFNGVESRRANGIDEVPIGNVMAYAYGRLIVALPDHHSYRIGDLIFGPSGTETTGYQDAVLKFTENNYLNEGGDFVARVFGAPSNDGPITMMKAVAQTDTQLGQGPLLIGTPYNVFTVQLPFDRTTWKNLTNPLQTNSPLIGPMGQDSAVLINGDLWYRGVDGIRSWIQAQRQFQSWGNTPMSAEIGEVLSADTQWLLQHGSGVLFDNRLLMTLSPALSPYGVYHRGLAVMDFNLVSTISQKFSPVWEGIWTDARVLKILKGLVNDVERCFAYVLSDNSEIELWELVPGAKVDHDTTAITWSFETPHYDFGNKDQFKRLETARIVLDDLIGTLSGTVRYRTDLSPCWNDWDTFQFCATDEDCGSDELTTRVFGTFTVPASGSTVVIAVEDAQHFNLNNPNITIGSYALTITAIPDSTHITVRNDDSEQAGETIANEALISYLGWESCNGPKTYREQHRTPIRLKMPPDTFDAITGEKYRTGYEFGMHFSLTGYGSIRKLLAVAKDEPEMLGISQRTPR